MTAESILKRFYTGQKHQKDQGGISIPKGARCKVCLIRDNDHMPDVLVNKPARAYELVRDELVSSDREILLSLLLDTRMNLIGIETVAIGSINVCGSTASEVFKSAILANSPGILLVHNHPSGSLDPSSSDIEFTKNLIKCGKLMGINVHDHLIVSSRGYVSMNELGLINVTD